jgi:DNA-binding NarL/FixJ family response regulator
MVVHESTCNLEPVNGAVTNESNKVNRSIRITLIEDHPEYREVIEMALEKDPGLELVNQFGTAERALRGFQNGPESETPDVILLDLNLPGISGLESIRWIKEYTPNAKIIVLTQSDMEENILSAIVQGASGYLLKSSTIQQIKQGIRTVVEGGATLDSGVAKFILEKLKITLPCKDTNREITEREMEVLILLADGFVKKEIAERLGISISTVVTHVSHIYEKLQVQNAPAAIAKAFRTGLFSPGRKE